MQTVEEQGSIGEELRALGLVLWDNLRLIVLVTLGTVALALLYIWTATVLYTSHVDLLIDPRARQTVESEVTPGGLGSSAAGADTLLLESQVEILLSQGVLDRLIKQEKLTDDPEFAGGGGGGGLIGTAVFAAKSLIYGPRVGRFASESAYDRTVEKLRERISVERQRNTYVIRATVKAEDPEKAARIANALAEIYIADVNEAASRSTGEAAGVLATKLEELRASLNRAASAVETYKQDNNLVGTGSSLVVERQLDDLNADLSRARSQAQDSRAQLNQLEQAVRGGISSETQVPDSAGSTVLTQIQTRLAEAESDLAELRSVFADRHPRIRRAEQRIASIREALRGEYTRILERRRVGLKVAEEKVASLEAALATRAQNVAASNTDSIELRELEREAASIRSVYEGFLTRSKEAREQVGIPSSTARLISEAYPASKPSDPPAVLLLIASIVFGLGLGVASAFLYHAVWGGWEWEEVPEGELEDDDEYEYA